MIQTGDKWRFYKANELDLPTLAEMKNLKSLIIWASTSSPSLKENDDGTYPSWIKPVIKLIKKAYHTFPNLKIMGVQLGSHLLSIALGGSVEKPQLDEAQKIIHFQNRGLFCGRDNIKLLDSFHSLPFVKDLYKAYNSTGVKLTELNVNSIYEIGINHNLPPNGVSHGFSTRTNQQIIWTLKDSNRVLGLQIPPSFNINIMHELIINKLYEYGKIDDPLKTRFTDDVYDTERPLMQHVLLKIINAFMVHDVAS